MASNGGFQNSGYNNDRPPSSTGSGDADVATDPASSSFFMNDYKKHDDLKQMLDTNKDNLKLEAMKRIIGMVAKGKDASDLFPAVVKNVVSKNLEVKKLVYVYLTRYAEEQQDLALLSISTFQRALKDPNQLIRASALRVLSSIRVPVIVPIMMLSIKESCNDMSPYVRKTAAHAIPKLFSLDPELKDQLIEVIEKLLADKTTLVAGSAIQAFEEVCPERIDLIHKNYRKLCNLLVDVEEWGQVVIINMLTRYARTQFVNPNRDDMIEEESEKAFYGSDEDEEKEDKEEEEDDKPKKKPYVMDPDHRLLLRNCKPLLNSRNAAVVMAVAQLYYHCAPRAEVGMVAKSLIRLLRSHKEVQYIVLSNIATMSVKRKGMFEPFLKSFYVHSTDPTHVKLLKLEILTNLGTETSISTIIREFQTYITSTDKEFAAATIQAIGRCASTIPEITDTCLNGLVRLMSNRDETVVAESVVVIKKLLQMQKREHKVVPQEHKDIIVHMAKMAQDITVPMARASILWMIGEYSDRVPKIAPDVLRQCAKNFINEEDIVKLQILNLAAKLCITNSKQTKLLCQYVFNLAKYDQNYDIRDRARFLRQLIIPGEKAGAFAKYAKKMFLATKPAPVLESKFKDRDQFQLATLSHVLNTKATGYREIPDFPEVAPDPTVRNVEVPTAWVADTNLLAQKKKKKGGKVKPAKKKSFYSDEESEEDEDEEEEEDSSDETDSSEEDSSEEEEESEEEEDEEDEKPKKKSKKVEDEEDEESSEEVDSSEEEESSEEEDEEEESSDEEPQPKAKSTKAKTGATSNAAMLLDLDLTMSLGDTLVNQDAEEAEVGSTVANPAAVGKSDFLMPVLAQDMSSLSLGGDTGGSTTVTAPSFIPTKTYELLNRITGGGLSITYRFTRTVSIFSEKMASVELTLTNSSDKPVLNVKIGDKKLQSGMEIFDFPEIGNLGVGATVTATMGINFADTTQPATFDVCTQEKKFSVTVKAPVGEQIQPVNMAENEFDKQQGKLSGMNENSGTVDMATENTDIKTISRRVYEVANVVQVPSMQDNTYKFAGKTLSAGALVLISVKLDGRKAALKVNCEKMVIGSMLLKDLKDSMTKKD
ncbi:AP-3 complex subunit beta-2 isoform X2 [Lingula anatina]|uniref:AP-3 complex subunit beta n=1 Tax=Lingula anatina TaxID=7574 RepID=A0A1S3JMW3_LINAN|nr:AP-3 complex subunit beta-2 isoform X2 [Lingula anatina]|eukprot:XP_013411486.1 AP-3 complex subunit beta-2 isoform X2 [Lingula anatina]